MVRGCNSAPNNNCVDLSDSNVALLSPSMIRQYTP